MDKSKEMENTSTATKLSGEGITEVVIRTKRRIGCGECGEDAIYKFTYLLPNARGNAASSGYRRDDCTWCSDHDEYRCEECAPAGKIPFVDCYEWCSKFTLFSPSGVARLEHMFLEWKTETITTPSADVIKQLPKLAAEVCFKSDTAIRWLRHAADGLTDESIKSEIRNHCDVHEKAVAELRKVNV